MTADDSAVPTARISIGKDSWAAVATLTGTGGGGPADCTWDERQPFRTMISHKPPIDRIHSLCTTSHYNRATGSCGIAPFGRRTHQACEQRGTAIAAVEVGR